MKKRYSFQEARRIARGHGFESAEEFLEYECPGAYGLPKNVREIYVATSEWKGWDDFLGIPLRYDEAKDLLRSQRNTRSTQSSSFITTKQEYDELVEDRKRKGMEDDPLSRLPYKPDLYYKKEWVSWNEWLA